MPVYTRVGGFWSLTVSNRAYCSVQYTLWLMVGPVPYGLELMFGNVL